MIRLANESLLVDVDPDRGAQVTTIGWPAGRNLLAWEDVAVPVPAASSATYGNDRLDWLSNWRGGWQELFPNAGQACDVDGIPLPFHGDVSTSRWEVTRREPTEAVLRCGSRLPLLLTRTMRLDPAEPVLRIEETVQNIGVEPVPYIWGHHPAFQARRGQVIDVPEGQDFVCQSDSDATDVAVGRGAWPYVRGISGEIVDLRIVPEIPCRRLLYLPNVRAGWAALRSSSREASVALAWDTTAFPHLWLWIDIEQASFPFYGNYRVIALEPQSSWPALGLASAIERSQAHVIHAGESRTAWVTVALFQGGESPVTGVTRDGRVEAYE